MPDAFFDRQSSMPVSGQTKPFPAQGILPAAPSQMVTNHWCIPSFAQEHPTAHHTDLWHPSPARRDLFDSENRASLFGLKTSFPPTHPSQIGCEETAYVHETGSGGHDPCFYSTHEQLTSLFHAIDPCLLANYSAASPTPGSTVEQPHLIETPPSGSAGGSGGVWQFLKMHSSSRYECLWEDGSGRTCGLSGTPSLVERHLQRDHRLNRCVIGVG